MESTPIGFKRGKIKNKGNIIMHWSHCQYLTMTQQIFLVAHVIFVAHEVILPSLSLLVFSQEYSHPLYRCQYLPCDFLPGSPWAFLTETTLSSAPLTTCWQSCQWLLIDSPLPIESKGKLIRCHQKCLYHEKGYSLSIHNLSRSIFKSLYLIIFTESI